MENRVLDIGTGSGYQAAVLSPLVSEVYTVEIVDRLYLSARCRLAPNGLSQHHTRLADGRLGWIEQAPFDSILVAAATEQVPETLLAQLKPGGRLILPEGKSSSSQWLKVIEKQYDGTIVEQRLLAVRFSL